MTDTAQPDAAQPDAAIVGRLSKLDRFLPVWIGLAMVSGIVLGKMFTGLDDTLDRVKIDTVSLPIAIGLLAMMYPVLAKVRYRSISTVIDRRSLTMSLVLNWLIGPALMFTLAWLLLPDLPEYRTGLIIVGLARCIAMVLIWNDLAYGNRELGAVLVAINSIFQIAAYSVLGYFYLELLPGWLGLDSNGIDVTIWEITKSVLIFLGIPLLAGFLTRTFGERAKGITWYEERFIPRIAPVALWGLLFTIVVLFALQGERITDGPFDVARIALPLILYFAIMWTGAFYAGYRLGFPYDRNTSIAFTAAGNNFELAIAVAIGVFGVSSGQALAGVVGPLIEVPVLVGLVYVALWARRRFYPRPGRARLSGGCDVATARLGAGLIAPRPAHVRPRPGPCPRAGRGTVDVAAGRLGSTP
ncbi:MAG: ACR3 family arsenite efflux transporter [Acidimicrobiales bacterium]|nr:ACR3 family arsenite efflux transporter [Acidimicrobiales bacterium]